MDVKNVIWTLKQRCVPAGLLKSSLKIIFYIQKLSSLIYCTYGYLSKSSLNIQKRQNDKNSDSAAVQPLWNKLKPSWHIIWEAFVEQPSVAWESKR